MFFKKRTPASSPVTIGVCSFTHNAGTTYFCIALSNYLCSKKKSSVAYIELNSTEEIISLKPGKLLQDHSFQMQGVYYYPSVTLKTISNIYAADYRYYVIDFGVISSCTLTEFCRCKQKYMICNPVPWKLNKLTEQYSELVKRNHIQESITLLVSMGIEDRTEAVCRQLKNLLHCRTLLLPFIKNPFQITSDEFEVFEKILKGV